MTREISGPELAALYKQFAADAEFGQPILADLSRRFGYTRRSTFQSDDALALAFREGQRSVLIHVGFMIDVDPAQLEDVENTEM